MSGTKSMCPPYPAARQGSAARVKKIKIKIFFNAFAVSLGGLHYNESYNIPSSLW